MLKVNDVICDQCGQHFTKTSNHMGGKRHFCNKQCFWNFRKGKDYGIFSKLTREKHPKWKGGRITSTTGYVMLYMPKHPSADKKGYVAEHRFVIEQSLGVTLNRSSVVHHINGNRSDNRLENLQLTNGIAHANIHKIWSYKRLFVPHKCQHCDNDAAVRLYTDKKGRKFRYYNKNCREHFARKKV